MRLQRDLQLCEYLTECCVVVGEESPMSCVRLTATGVVEAVTGSVVSTVVGIPRLSVPVNVAPGASRGSMTVVIVPFMVTM